METLSMSSNLWLRANANHSGSLNIFSIFAWKKNFRDPLNRFRYIYKRFVDRPLLNWLNYCRYYVQYKCKLIKLIAWSKIAIYSGALVPAIPEHHVLARCFWWKECRNTIMGSILRRKLKLTNLLLLKTYSKQAVLLVVKLNCQIFLQIIGKFKLQMTV